MGRRPAFSAIGLSAATAFSFLLAAPSLAQQHHWTVHNLEAQKFMQYGNRSAAEEELLKAAEAARNIGSNDPRLAVTLRQLGHLYLQDQKYADSMHCLEQAIEIDRNVLNADDPELRLAEQDLSVCKQHINDPPSAEPKTSNAESTESTVQNALMSQSTDKEVEKVAISSVQTTESSSPSSPTSVTVKKAPWMISWEKGRDFYARHDYAGAEKSWRKAVEQSKAEKSDHAINYCINSLLLSFYAQKKFAQAEPFYRKSMEQIARAKGKDSAEYKQALDGYDLLKQSMQKRRSPKPVATKSGAMTFWGASNSHSAFTIPKRASAQADDEDPFELAAPGDEERDLYDGSRKSWFSLRPHEPDMVRLVSTIIATVLAIKTALRVGPKFAGFLVPKDLSPFRKTITGYLCWSTLIWWIIPLAGFVGSCMAREYASRDKAKAGTFIQISEVVWTLSMVSWGLGAIYTVFFK